MYEVDPLDGFDRIPSELLVDLAELRAALELELSPWTVGHPWIAANPTGLRVASFGDGRGLLVFGVRDTDRRVAVSDLVVL